MKVQSTGLGKSVMLAHINDLAMTAFEDEPVLKMTMESTEPLHWYIQVYMTPADVRQAILKGMRPRLIWKTMLALLFKRFALFGGGKQAAAAAPPPAAAKPEAPAAPAEEKAAANPLARLKG